MKKIICLLTLTAMSACNKNGWDMSFVKSETRVQCTRFADAVTNAIELNDSRRQSFIDDYVPSCVDATLEAINPCIVEYQRGSDSAIKCIEARTTPAIASFNDSMMQKLHANDPK